MKDNRFSMLCVAGIVVGTVCTAAEATLPDDQTIRYNIREIPSDPESDVIFTITLELSANQADGDSVGWQIDEVRFVRISDEAEWIEDYGTNSKPSLWWVDHADHHSPELSEFAMPPLLTGMAEAVLAPDPDLEYSIVGKTCDTACQEIYTPSIAAALDLLLWVDQEPEPEVDDEDETVEIDSGEDPF